VTSATNVRFVIAVFRGDNVTWVNKDTASVTVAFPSIDLEYCKDRGCSGSQRGCVERRDCDMMAAYKYSKEKESIKFTLIGGGNDTGRYLALDVFDSERPNAGLVFNCSYDGATASNTVGVFWKEGGNQTDVSNQVHVW